MSVAGAAASGFLILNSGLFFGVLNLEVTSDCSVRHTGIRVVARMAREFRFRNKFATRNLGDPRARVEVTV
jgi:hypothetical protein